jgi:hypothetical protein
MPYTIRYVKGDRRPYKIVNESNKIVGTSVTKSNAEASIRSRLAGEHKKK